MEFLKARKNLILLLGGLLLICIFLLLFSFSLLKQQTSPSSSTGTSSSQNSKSQKKLPTPYPTDFYSSQYKQSVKQLNKQDDSVLQEGVLVTKFENILPYQGSYISVYYTQDINQVVLMIDRNHQQEANAEFDALLAKYHISNRSWFPNLVSAFIEPTPGP
jgi:hypothetical protein